MSVSPELHYETWATRMGAMKEASPDIARGFGSMFQKLMGEGALSVREKELIALAIGMSVRCDECVYAHLEKAFKAGATREQILEMAGVVVVMQGGPGYVHVPMLLEAMEVVERRMGAAAGV